MQRDFFYILSTRGANEELAWFLSQNQRMTILVASGKAYQGAALALPFGCCDRCHVQVLDKRIRKSLRAIYATVSGLDSRVPIATTE